MPITPPPPPPPPFIYALCLLHKLMAIRRMSYVKCLFCAVPQLPEGEHIRYVAYDFKAAAKRPGAGLLADIAPVIARCLDATGVFLCAPAPPGLAARRAGPIDWVRRAQDLASGKGVE